jgi:hypothetical protein
MAKKGRPFVYQSDTEKPVTVSLRLPRDLYARVERYVKMHPGMTLTEFFLDGARLRLDTPADPRDLLLSDDNTVIQEVQEMIRAAVQAEIGKLSDFMRPHFSTPAPEAPVEPVPDISHNGNAVIQEEAPKRPGRQSTLRQPIIDLLRQHREGLTAVQIKVLLGVDKNIGDTLAGMVRDQLIEKRGSGNTVRYLAVAAPSTDTRELSQTKRQATSTRV